MAQLGNCCFIVPLRPATMMIGLSCMIVSFIGLLLTTSSTLSFLTHPTDPLLRWLLKVCYFVGKDHGVAFHAIFFIVSTLLVCGIVSRISQLMVPWLAASPLIMTAIGIQMVLVIIEKPDLSMPVVCFALLLMIFFTYATLVIAAYYREITRSTVRIRLFNLRSGELPRIVEVPQRISGPFFSQRRYPETSDPTAGQPLSDNPLVSSETRAPQNWPTLRQAYVRLMQVIPQVSLRNEQLPSVQETRF